MYGFFTKPGVHIEYRIFNNYCFFGCRYLEF